LFTDAAAADTVGERGTGIGAAHRAGRFRRRPAAGGLAGRARQPARAGGDRARLAFNIIYSSGTTGTPKGIVQSHGMRWAHVTRGALRLRAGHRHAAVHAAVLQHHAGGVLPHAGLRRLPCADAQVRRAAYLQLAQQHRVTHTMLVPVQYQRLMARPDFDAHDLSSFRMKFSTSAPFNAALKADVLKRWPGGLVEFYGLTEGGGTCILEAHCTPTSCTPWAARPKATTSA
jgi:long-chain acyl-CoA synthetase